VTVKNPYGEPYPACTTIQYEFRPSSNSTILAVEPQATQVLTTTKTPEQIQQEAGVQVWGEPTGMFPPWYKINIKFLIATLGLSFHSWIGIVGFGLVEMIGLENILATAFNVPPEILSAAQGATINGIITATATFAAGAAGTMLSRASPWYFLLLMSYFIGGFFAMLGIYELAEKYTARSILFGIGFALIGFTTGLFVFDWLTNWHRSILTSYTSGSSAQIAAVKGTVNFFMGTAIKAAIMLGLGLLILDTPFLVASLALGIWAILLALSIPV